MFLSLPLLVFALLTCRPGRARAWCSATLRLYFSGSARARVRTQRCSKALEGDSSSPTVRRSAVFSLVYSLMVVEKPLSRVAPKKAICLTETDLLWSAMRPVSAEYKDNPIIRSMTVLLVKLPGHKRSIFSGQDRGPYNCELLQRSFSRPRERPRD